MIILILQNLVCTLRWELSSKLTTPYQGPHCALFKTKVVNHLYKI